MESKQRPPLGVKPEWLWRAERVKALMAAIDRTMVHYLTTDNPPGSAARALGKAGEWADELERHLSWMKAFVAENP